MGDTNKEFSHPFEKKIFFHIALLLFEKCHLLPDIPKRSIPFIQKADVLSQQKDAKHEHISPLSMKRPIKMNLHTTDNRIVLDFIFL